MTLDQTPIWPCPLPLPTWVPLLLILFRGEPSASSLWILKESWSLVEDSDHEWIQVSETGRIVGAATLQQSPSLLSCDRPQSDHARWEHRVVLPDLGSVLSSHPKLTPTFVIPCYCCHPENRRLPEVSATHPHTAPPIPTVIGNTCGVSPPT